VTVIATPSEVHAVPDARQAAERPEHEPPDGVPGLIGQLDPERRTEVGDVHPTVHPPAPLTDRLEHGSLVVVLVDDLPDDLLEDVLDGDDADDLAVLVDDEREMDRRRLQVTQQVPARRDSGT
jgi:hypothetical protein